MEASTETKIPTSSLQNEPQWFALKVSRKESLAMKVMEDAGLRAYCPMAATDTTIHGQKKIVERPLIPNTIFVFAPFRRINALKNQNTFITYCYKKVDGKFKILQVPTREMELFIDSSTKMKNDITYFHPEEVELKPTASESSGVSSTVTKAPSSKPKAEPNACSSSTSKCLAQ